MTDTRIFTIKDKVINEKRISEEEALFLLSNETTLGEVGELAHLKRNSLHNDKAFYVQSFHLNMTNICAYSCRFCSFRRKPDDVDAYALSTNEAMRLIEKAVEFRAKEIHFVNALNPEMPLKRYLEVVERALQKFPDLSIKGFTAVEIDFFARTEHISYEQVLDSFKSVGISYLPGGGAELFDSAVRRKLGTNKISGETWLKIHELAHRKGFVSNATMLFGHFENPVQIIEHLSSLRKLQDRTGGFKAFIPLRFVPHKTRIKMQETSALNVLRIVAVSRLFLDNFPHIKAYWVSLTPEIAQVALSFGADDLDGTIMKERIMHEAGAEVKEGLTPEEMRKLITDAGFVPVERDSFYKEIKEDASC